MKKSILWIACAIVVVTSSSVSVFGYSFPETHGASTRSMSLGNAFTAVADDYSASYFNPAGLAQTHKTTFTLGIIQPIHNMEVTFLDDGQNIEFTDNRGVKYGDPVKGSDGNGLNTYYSVLGFSLNINRLLKSKVNVPINTQLGIFAGLPGNFNHTFTLNTTPPDMPTFISFGDKIEHFSISIGLGLELKKDLIYFGLGTNIGATMAGEMQIHGAWIGDAVRDVIVNSYTPTTAEYAFSAGLLFTPFDRKLKIGTAYREELNSVRVEIFPINVYSNVGIRSRRMQVSTDFIVGYVPEQFSVGAAYEFDYFTVSIDCKLKNWSEFPYTNTVYTLYHVDEQEMIEGNPGFEDPGSPDFDDVMDLGVGFEYRHKKKLVLTAGYEFRPTPVPDQSYRVSNYLDMDKNIFSFGISYKITNWMKIDGLAQYMLLDDFTVHKTGLENGYAWGPEVMYEIYYPQKSYKVEGDAFVFGLSVEFNL